MFQQAEVSFCRKSNYSVDQTGPYRRPHENKIWHFWNMTTNVTNS